MNLWISLSQIIMSLWPTLEIFKVEIDKYSKDPGIDCSGEVAQKTY